MSGFCREKNIEGGVGGGGGGDGGGGGGGDGGGRVLHHPSSLSFLFSQSSILSFLFSLFQGNTFALLLSVPSIGS